MSQPWLQPLGARALTEVGGKALNVARLQAIPQVVVPRSWVLSANAFAALIEQHYSARAFGRLVRAFVADNEREAVLAELAHLRWPPGFEASLRRLLPKRATVIVRSSGTLEDGRKRSLAGHYESIVVSTEPEKLLWAIKSCWLVGLRVYLDQLRAASNRQYEVLGQRAIRSVALLIQEVVNASCSGVYFSQSPIHPGRALVVANWGSCHALVEGRFANDSYLLNNDGQLESQQIPYKFEMTTVVADERRLLPGQPFRTPAGPSYYHSRLGPAVAVARVPETRSGLEVLGRQKLAKLHRTATAISRAFGDAIDMEWSFRGSTLIVLQVRPITTQPPKAPLPSGQGTYGIASPGIATGPVRIVLSPADDERVQAHDILAVRATDPDYMPMLRRVAGILSEDGSPLSHTAIVARELGVPCLTGVTGATSGLFMDGEMIRLDADAGRIERGLTTSAPTPIRTRPPTLTNVCHSVEALRQRPRSHTARLAFSALWAEAHRLKPGLEPDLQLLHDVWRALEHHLSRRVGLVWDLHNDEQLGAVRLKSLFARLRRRRRE